MKVRNLDTFYWIATLGSFRAASNKLNLTQPAISSRIQVLERDLGAEVFVREVRNAELTPEGRRLLPFAAKLMQLDQDVLAEFHDTTTIEQTIRLGSSETIVSTWLPDFLGHSVQFNSGLSFDLAVDTTDNLRDALVAREIDLAFLMGPVSEASITNHELCTYEMVFAANPKVAKQKKTWALGDLAAHSILTFANTTKPSRQIRELLMSHSPVTLNMTTSSSLGALIRLASQGFGICAIPKAVIYAELQSKELVIVDTAVKLPTIRFTASYVSGSANSQLMANLCSEISGFLKPRLIKNIYQM